MFVSRLRNYATPTPTLKSSTLNLVKKLTDEQFIAMQPVDLLQRAREQYLLISKQGVCQEVKQAAQRFIFDLADKIFRIIWKEPGRKEAWIREFSSFSDLEHTAIARAIENLKNDSRTVIAPYHFLQISESGILPRSYTYVIPKLTPVPVLRVDRPIKILQSSVETPIHRFAGLGSVVKDLASAHEKWKINDEKAPTYQGFYPLYTGDIFQEDGYLSDFYPYCVIPHYYEGQEVYSTIYRSKTKKTFLVNPDEKFKDVFSLADSDKTLYSPAYGYNCSDRGLYLASALAVFSVLYRGKKGDKKIDLVRGDSLAVAAPCFSLLATMELYMPKQWVPRKISILHGPVGESFSNIKFLGIGAVAGGSVSTLVATVAQLADATIPVSSHYERCLQGENHRDNEALSIFLGPKIEGFKFRSRPVTNGFHPAAYDPKESVVSGIFARDLDTDILVNPTVFTDMKAAITKALFKAGKLGSSTLPVVYYIGRFHRDKGIDLLPALVKEALKKGAQVVVMGVNCGYEAPIDQIRQMALENPLIRVYDKDQQLESVSYVDAGRRVDTGASLAMLIRSSAMLGLVLSHKEPMGLVPLETMQSCPVLAPFHEGFVDTLVPYDNGGLERSFLGNKANAFTYENSHDVAQAVAALNTAFDKFILLQDKPLQNQILMSIRTQTAQKHAWYKSPSEPGTLGRLLGVYNEVCSRDLTPSYKLPDGFVQVSESRNSSPRVAPPSLPRLRGIRRFENNCLFLCGKVSILFLKITSFLNRLFTSEFKFFRFSSNVRLIKTN